MNISWKNHGIGTRFVAAELSEVDPTYFSDIHDYAKDCQTYLHLGRGLLLSGSVGCGKSYATVALMKYMREHQDSRFDFYFVTAPDMFELMDEGIDAYRLKRWVDVFTTIPALVINDLGKEEREKSNTVKLGRLLRKRHEAALPIFITTNLPIVAEKPKKGMPPTKTVEGTYGTSVWSLLYEMTEFRAQISAPDRRLARQHASAEEMDVSHE